MTVPRQEKKGKLEKCNWVKKATQIKQPATAAGSHCVAVIDCLMLLLTS